jgi:lamin tail-like protein/IPT/TIG domain-containing protein/CotH protein
MRSADPGTRSKIGGLLVLPAAVLCLALGAGRPAGAITFTEIHYDPPGTAEEKTALKFIEIFNDQSVTIDLTGYHFSEGVVFDFPPGMLFRPRKYLVIAADAEAVKAHFGIQNVLGNFSGNLSSDGDQLVLVNGSAATVAKVDYSNRGQWPSIPAGTGYTLSIKNPYLADDRPENWTISAHPGGTPGAENFPAPFIEEKELFGENTPWRYQKGWDGTAMAPFSTPATAWRDPGFDDAGWPEGTTGIGYGDGTSDVTALDDMKDHYISFAARKRFTIPPEIQAQMEAVVLKLRFDDGYVAYLNGVEVGRLNVGTADVPFDLPAAALKDVTATPTLVNIPLEKLLPGENVLAVEVHNRTLTDSDSGLIPSLLWRRTIVPDNGSRAPIRVNEVLREPWDGPERWLELYNAGDSEVELEGFSLTDDPAQPDRFVIPKGLLPAGGFAGFTESALGFSLAGSGSKKELRIYVYQPDRATVADAVILESHPRAAPTGALSQARYPDGADAWYISSTPTLQAPNHVPLERDVVLNEIMYHPMVGPTATLPDGQVLQRGEFIELYNRSDRSIPLGRWALTKGYNYVFHDGFVLDKKSYVVLAPDPDYIIQTYLLPAEQVLGPDADGESQAAFGTLSDSGESIRLEDPLGNPVQDVRYFDGGDWSPLADGGGSSLELIDPNQDNTLASAWAPSDETSRAPWTQYTYTANNVQGAEPEFWLLLLDDGQCLIDEVSVKKGETEYIPNGSFESAISNPPWRITGTHIWSKRITTEAHAGSACLQLIATGGGDNRVNHAEVDATTTIPSGSVNVSFWARWLQGCQILHTCGNNNNTLMMNHLLVVPPDLGTPGRENGVRARLRDSTGSDDLGPVIGEVRHVPAVPRSTVPVTILARISDSDGVDQAIVEYRLSRKTGTLLTAPMYDDGQHGDGAAGDGLYGGTVPPQPNLARVLFNVAAADSGGRWRRFPVNAPDRTLLYQVGEPYTSPGLRYRMILDDDNKGILEGRLLHSDDPVYGAFVFEESVPYYNIGVRYHGSPWNRPSSSGPYMFSLSFPSDHTLRGYSRVNISRYASAMNEGTAYFLAQRAFGGDKAHTPTTPRYNYLKFYYNGVPHSGSAMGEIIPPGGEYFRTEFPDDSAGFGYKITGKLEFNDQGQFTNNVQWTQFHYYGPTKESYRYFYNPANNEGDDNFEPLMRLLEIMDPAKTPLAKFEDPNVGIESILNVEAFLRVFIIRVLQDDWDTIGIGNGQNSYVYYAPKEGRFYLLPWDMDHTFDNSRVKLAPLLPAELSMDPGVRRMINDSAKYKRVYMQILKEIVTNFWNTKAMDPWLNAVGDDVKGLTGGPGSIHNFMADRVTYLNSRFPLISRNINFAITQPPGGKPFAVKASQATIGGTAPFEVVKFYLEPAGQDAQEVTPTWVGSTSTDWRLTVPLAREKNSFKIYGFNSSGEPVGTLSIDIYDATDWPAPTITAIDPASGPAAGGTKVSVTGTGFQEGVTVFIGALAATNLERVSSTELRMDSPAGAAGQADVRVVNLDSLSASAAGAFTFISGPSFIRGDFDGTGIIDITDVFNILDYLYRSGTSPCLKAGDVDDNAVIEITDPIYLLEYMFLAGPPPAAPFPAPGPDTTPDPLDCGG